MKHSSGCLVAILPALLSGAACSERSEARSAEVGAVRVEPVAHGNHDPNYGGVVYMHGNLHFEVVFEPDGGHRVYFSNEVRTELPASVVSGVRINVSRPGEAAEELSARIDESGESWVATGRRVDGAATARVSFMTPDGPYFIDVPVLTAHAP